jgi:replication-associated recombination protein RarA
MNVEAKLTLFFERNENQMTMHHSTNGYSRWELMSALHKSVRKGDERRAAAYALEMATKDKSWHSMTLNYLQTIAHEDVSVADMTTATYVMTTCQYLRDYYDRKKHVENMGLTNCVIALCRAKKCHDGVCLSEIISGELGCFEWRQGLENKIPEIPDYCYDMHTKRGREMGRGVDHFLTECFWDMHNEVDSHYKEEYNDLVSNRTASKRTTSHYQNQAPYKFQEPEIKRDQQSEMFND